MINTIFQFCIPVNPRSFRKVFQEERDPKIIMVFDLEDGVQSVIEPQLTTVLKKKVRNNIATFLNQYTERNYSSSAGIRINSFSSSAFKEDVLFLKSISTKVKWKNIFLPKINSHKEIISYINTFHENNIAFEEVIPIIETGEGYRNMSSIFKYPVEATFRRAVWGNHDFNLDCGYWPFQDMNSPLHWTRMEEFISCLKKVNYEFINSPILELDNNDLSMAVLNEAFSLCKSGFSQVALSYNQALLFLKWQNDPLYSVKSFFQRSQPDQEEKIKLARSTIEQFRACQLYGKSFSVIEKHKKIISPQEFTAAQNFLNENS